MSFLDEVTAIWGGRGSGKTTLARKLITEANPPVVVSIDPMAPEGVAVRDLYAAINKGKRNIVVNAQVKSQQLTAIYIAYLASTKARPVYIICDEAPAYMDSDTAMLNKIFFQGRHRAFGMMLLGQRPKSISLQNRSQAITTYWMRLNDDEDIKTAATKLGIETARSLSSFKPGQFIQHPPKGT